MRLGNRMSQCHPHFGGKGLDIFPRGFVIGAFRAPLSKSEPIIFGDVFCMQAVIPVVRLLEGIICRVVSILHFTCPAGLSAGRRLFPLLGKICRTQEQYRLV
ncbi:hypothetical protein NKW53_12605 [Acetobacter orientalis]|nr:hypothetical protein [Acetobacter orientalis]MCP1216903.1 hypothetical protein [Acetobacter orientalis]MCP1219750.1 hypothetical protein [Acetobacter orientalis]